MNKNDLLREMKELVVNPVNSPTGQFMVQKRHIKGGGNRAKKHTEGGHSANKKYAKGGHHTKTAH